VVERSLTIYVRDRDQRVFDAAREYAEAHRMSLSTLIAMVLEQFLEQHK
jgi:hypothetical protein